jgi:hypothetical protein
MRPVQAEPIGGAILQRNQVQLDQSHWPCHVKAFIESSMIAASWLNPETATQRPQRTTTLIAAVVVVVQLLLYRHVAFSLMKLRRSAAPADEGPNSSADGWQPRRLIHLINGQALNSMILEQRL